MHLNSFKNNLLLTFAVLFIGISQSGHAGLKKAEIAPAYVHIDTIEFKKTVKEADMGGIRVEFLYTYGCFMLKYTDLYAMTNQKHRDHARFSNNAISFGPCIPITARWTLIPSIGIAHTKMKTRLHYDLGALGSVEIQDHFRAFSYNTGLEVVCSFTSSFRLCATIQYAWARSKTHIKPYFKFKSHSEGASYGLMLEYDVAQTWSINLGGGYNESLSKEKDGLRARGAKFGIAKWF